MKNAGLQEICEIAAAIVFGLACVEYWVHGELMQGALCFGLGYLLWMRIWDRL